MADDDKKNPERLSCVISFDDDEIILEHQMCHMSIPKWPSPWEMVKNSLSVSSLTDVAKRRKREAARGYVGATELLERSSTC